MGQTAIPAVLVIEDEPIQRMTLVDLVEDAGYEALEAWDADTAVAILETRTDIRVVLTDIDMPGSVDGLALAAAIRGRWPPIEIIVTSAGREPAEEKLPARSIFLPKPVSDRDATRAIRQLLSET